MNRKPPPLSFAIFHLVSVAALASTFAVANAATLFYDSFSYPNGNLLGQGGWYSHSAAGSKPVQVTDGSIVVQQSAGSGEDVTHLIPARAATDITVASFTLTVPAGSIIGAANDYFAHFRPTGTDSFNFVARTFIGPPIVGGSDYTLGIAAGSLGSTPVASWPDPMVFDQTYRVVISYNGATGTSTLWVDPTSLGDPSISSTSAPLAGRLLTSIAFRQASPAGATFGEVVDNVIVAEELPTCTSPGIHPDPPLYTEVHIDSAAYEEPGPDYFYPIYRPIQLGGMVRWVNNTLTAHRLVSGDGYFDSGVMPPGTDFCFDFTTCDVPDSCGYDYSCTLHPGSSEVGLIRVFASIVLDVPSIRIPLAGFSLEQNIPNPVRMTATRIGYRIPAPGGPVLCRIHDAGGRLVRTLFEGNQTPGTHGLIWDGSDEHGTRVRPGIYWYSVRFSGAVLQRRAVVLK